MDDWYKLVQDDQLQQGDFIRNLNVYVQDSPDNPEKPQPEFDVFPLSVIMSQSCDLVPERGDEYALLCAVHTVDRLADSDVWGIPSLSSRWKAAKKGDAVNYHPLAPCTLEGHERPAALVDFKRVFEVRIARLMELSNRHAPWVRLLPPYREQLAQRFASKIMRIGLPIEVPEWTEIETWLESGAGQPPDQPVQGVEVALPSQDS